MTNEELMGRMAEGDESALLELCENNSGFIHGCALKIAKSFNCLGRGENTKETLSELESVGMLAFVECVRGGRYDPAQGTLTAFVTPFIEAAMRRHMETSLGTLSLDPRSMALVRKAKRLRNVDGLSDTEIAEALSITESEVKKALVYSTHFHSIYDLTDADDGGDVYDHITDSEPNPMPEEIVFRMIRAECLKELFDGLTKKEQDIIRKSFGVFEYEKQPLRDIAMYHMMREDAVEKAKNRALEKMRCIYPGSRLRLWNSVLREIDNVG